MNLGVHLDLQPSAYHRLPWQVWASASVLKQLHNSTPAKLRVWLEEPDDPTAEMILGTLTHSLILEPDKPLPKLAITPEVYGVEGKNWNRNAKECQRWEAAQRDLGCVVLKPKEHVNILGMAWAIAKHPLTKAIFHEGKSEVSILAHYEKQQMFVKCRLDWIPPGYDLVDVKTTSSVEERDFTRIAYDLGYHIQAALYLDLWNALCGADEPKSGFKFVAIETKAPYSIQVYPCTRAFLDRGRSDYTMLLEKFANCVANNFWPDRPEIELPLDLPKYVT